jgi:hypothetical protein
LQNYEKNEQLIREGTTHNDYNFDFFWDRAQHGPASRASEEVDLETDVPAGGGGGDALPAVDV